MSEITLNDLPSSKHMYGQRLIPSRWLIDLILSSIGDTEVKVESRSLSINDFKCLLKKGYSIIINHNNYDRESSCSCLGKYSEFAGEYDDGNEYNGGSEDCTVIIKFNDNEI